MNSPGNRYKRHRRAVGIHNMVREAIDDHIDIPEYPFEQVELHFVFFFPSQIHTDLENLRAACKPYVDGMVKFGILIDDNRTVVMRDVVDQKDRKNDPGFTINVIPRGERCLLCLDALDWMMSGS